MTYEECEDLVRAYTASVELVSDAEVCDMEAVLKGATCVNECLGGLIASLLYESPIGDRRNHD